MGTAMNLPERITEKWLRSLLTCDLLEAIEQASLEHEAALGFSERPKDRAKSRRRLWKLIEESDRRRDSNRKTLAAIAARKKARL